MPSVPSHSLFVFYLEIWRTLGFILRSTYFERRHQMHQLWISRLSFQHTTYSGMVDFSKMDLLRLSQELLRKSYSFFGLSRAIPRESESPTTSLAAVHTCLLTLAKTRENYRGRLIYLSTLARTFARDRTIC